MELYTVLNENRDIIKQQIGASGSISVNIDKLLDCFLSDIKTGTFEKLKAFAEDIIKRYVVQTHDVDVVPTLYNKLLAGCGEVINKYTHNDTEDFLQYIKIVREYVNNATMHYMSFSLEIQREIIRKQNKAILELSTPILTVYKSILLLPVIGTIDTERSRQIMENLLDAIVANQAEIVLVDISGVPIVDTQVAHHLMKTIQAAKLLGTSCILVGIRPELAQTIVKLGIDFSYITTKNNLQSGIETALKMLHYKIEKLEQE